MSNWLVYLGEREGTFGVNSRQQIGKKYKVSKRKPFEVPKADLWIASLPGYRVLNEVSFVPTTIRVANPIEGYLTRWEGSFIEGLASSLPDPARVVEVGTGSGASLVRILLGLSHHADVMVWSIDLLDCKSAEEYVQKCQIPNWRYKLIVEDSVEVGTNWTEPLDMIYLDGSHAHEGVLADVAAWSPHLKDDGVVVFHDYGSRKHKVTRAVNESMKGWHKVGRVDLMIAFEREASGRV
jgi:predicted O-methyltransferase YrrM